MIATSFLVKSGSFLGIVTSPLVSITLMTSSQSLRMSDGIASLLANFWPLMVNRFFTAPSWSACS